ncbi:MAG: hypothetical protein PHY93_11395 [Bacteriovorax sp.]|nr:hypothetical protein [Bacteriovorax sp.]
MFKNLSTLIILLFSTVLFASSESIKTEYELKIPLTQIGFQKFKTLFIDHFQAEETTRTDLYFDIFESHHFILKNLSDPIKLRFQDSKWQIQKSHSLKGLGSITAKESQSISIDEDPYDTQKIYNDIIDFHRELTDLNPLALNTATKISDQLFKLKLLRKATKLCSLCTEEKAYYSSQMNHKNRYKVKIKEKGLEFIMFVGATTSGLIESYELEAELKNSNDVEKALSVLTNWLNDQGLSPGDISSTPAPAQDFFVEKNLNLILSASNPYR